MLHFRKTLAHVAGLLAVPYGYTVSLWTASAVPTAHFGPPGGGEIAAFVAGALVAFLLVGAVARVDLAHQVPSPVSSAIVLNILPMLALALAPVSLLVAWKPVGFCVASFLVTLGYAIGVTVFLELAVRQKHSDS
ncbi:MAG: hypothetical protein M3336_04850 [Chloroflexota bacterium]|nr:hypothetical protein [Chloroflexota bacterium]